MDPLLWQFGLILGGCLTLAALGILAVERFLHRDVSRVWPTFYSWLFMIPLTLVALYLGREVTIIGLLILSLVGFYEFARAAQLISHRWLMVVTWGSMVATSACILIPCAEGQFGWRGGFAAMPAWALAAIFVVPILQNKKDGFLNKASLACIAYLLIGWMFAHCAWLANREHATGLLLFFLFAVELTDIAAFTFGSLMGKHLLCSEISPNKTWEGAIGAFVVAMATPWLLRFALPDNIGLIRLLLMGLVIGIGSQLGDLVVSLIKRNLDVKDMGNSIPGHGGVLDRIDSLLITSPLFLYTLRFFDS